MALGANQPLAFTPLAGSRPIVRRGGRLWVLAARRSLHSPFPNYMHLTWRRTGQQNFDPVNIKQKSKV